MSASVFINLMICLLLSLYSSCLSSDKPICVGHFPCAQSKSPELRNYYHVTHQQFSVKLLALRDLPFIPPKFYNCHPKCDYMSSYPPEFEKFTESSDGCMIESDRVICFWNKTDDRLPVRKINYTVPVFTVALWLVVAFCLVICSLLSITWIILFRKQLESQSYSLNFHQMESSVNTDTDGADKNRHHSHPACDTCNFSSALSDPDFSSIKI